MSTAKYAILRAKIEGAIVDLLVKTHASNVYVDDTTTLAAKLAEIITDLGSKATSAELSTAISNLRTELMGEGVPEAYDTFKELADYIAEHQDVADALTAAIGDKADKSTVEAIQTTVNALGALSTLNKVSEDYLDDALKEKVNAAAQGNHSHANKALLDTYTQTEADLADAVSKKHEHANKVELDKIAEGDKAKWDAMEQNTKDYADGLNEAMDTRVKDVEGKTSTLIGEDTGKSARTIANEELAKQLVPESAAESLDTLSEIAAWIQSHPDDASAMNAAITALQNKLSGIDDGNGTVKMYIDDAITALKIGDYAKASDLTALAERVTTLEGKSHEHANKAVLDGITADQVSAWDGKAKVYGASETVDLPEGVIFVQLVD